ncbi:hypothetical protein QTP88_029569 [Uroleucon formosanum]
MSKSQSSRKIRKIKPWITSGLVTSIKNRDKLNMKIKKDPSNHKLISYYKAYRNKLTMLIRKAKEQSYVNKVENCQGNGRVIWNVINELSRRKVDTTTGLPINEIIKDIYPTSTPKDYLNLVNSYFATTGKRLVDNNFSNSTNNIQSNFGINTNNKSNTSSNFKLDTIGSHEVKNILNNLNNNSAPGVDGYTALFFKQTGDNVILPIVHIINCSVTNGTVPDELKVARIVPIHKKGDKTDFTNYRPISIVGILAKILEKIIKNQLLDYLERDKLIFTGQYGYRKNVASVPLNDIKFLRELKKYEEIDKIVSEVAINKCINHLYYLTDECAAFALFDESIDIDIKVMMANKINEQTNIDEPEVYAKKLNLKINEITTFLSKPDKKILISLLSPKSTNIFHRFKIEKFLHIHPSKWLNSSAYQKGKTIIEQLRIVNDSAERGVKLVEDYNNSITRDKNQK